ncbi:MAG: peroxiredoxin-like family protein [Ktedonobacterales bacterium]
MSRETSEPAPTIASQVAALHKGRSSDNVWAVEQAALSRTMLTSALPLDADFPDGELLSPTGEPTTLAATLNGSAGVIVFYRGAWCPYCNLALATYRSSLSHALAQRGIVLVAVSPQTPDGSLSMQEKHDLDFAVLSDPGNQIAGALGILTHPSVAAREAQLAHGLDLTKINADGTTTVPMPTVAIIDRSGKLAWIDIHPDYSTRTEPQQILDALDQLGL